MAWSWSVTVEAMQALRLTIAKQPREWLRVVFAEWKSSPRGFFHPDRYGDAEFDEARYQRALKKAEKLPDDVLAEKIYELAERLSTCTNGAWEAWCCPHGCTMHMLPWGELDPETGELVEEDPHEGEECASCGDEISAGEGCSGPNGSVHESCFDPDDDGMAA